MSESNWLPMGPAENGVSWQIRDDGKTTEMLATADVTDHLEQNKAMMNHNDGYSPSRELRRVASIPAIIILKWKEELGVDFYSSDPEQKRKVRQLLNSNEYLFLRTAPGRI
jgi:hypothetical protein